MIYVCRRSLGGKLGETVMEKLQVETMGELKKFTLQHLQADFGDKTGLVGLVLLINKNNDSWSLKIDFSNPDCDVISVRDFCGDSLNFTVSVPNGH